MRLIQALIVFSLLTFSSLGFALDVVEVDFGKFYVENGNMDQVKKKMNCVESLIPSIEAVFKDKDIIGGAKARIKLAKQAQEHVLNGDEQLYYGLGGKFANPKIKVRHYGRGASTSYSVEMFGYLVQESSCQKLASKLTAEHYHSMIDESQRYYLNKIAEAQGEILQSNEDFVAQ